MKEPSGKTPQASDAIRVSAAAEGTKTHPERTPTGGFKLCPYCAEEIRVEATKCRHCGELFTGTKGTTANVEPTKVLGFAGSAIMAVAVFFPILRVPVIGSINYIANGRGDGVIVLVLALLGLLLTVRGSYRWLVVPGLGTLAVLAFTFIQLQRTIDEATAQLNRDLAGNPFRSIADAAIASVGLEWGFAMVALGAIVLLSAAVIDARS